MPLYDYEHTGRECELGKVFEVEQSMKDDPIKKCPCCGRVVKRLISRVFISSPTSDSEYKNMGFTKLVRRDKGVYENVTALDKESRVFEADKPETMPDLKSRISD